MVARVNIAAYNRQIRIWRDDSGSLRRSAPNEPVTLSSKKERKTKKMKEVKASDNINVLVPENDQQELWQMSGRVNALHDWIASEAGGQYFSNDLTMVCAVMGFTDIIKARAERDK